MKLKELTKTKINIIFVVILVLQVLTMIYWGYQKSNFYWDEFHTYQDAHNFWTPYRNGYYLNNIIEYDQWNLVSDLRLLYVVNDSNDIYSGWNDGVSSLLNFFNCSFDVPYSLLLSFVESIFYRGVISKWAGISINIIVLCVLQLWLYRFSDKLFKGNKLLSLFAVVVYGFSAMAISMVEFVRNYMLLALLLVVATWLFYLFWVENRWYIAIIFELLAAFLMLLCFKSSEVTGFYSIGLFSALSVGIILSKQYKKLFYSTIPGILAGGYYLVFKTRYIQEILHFSQSAGEEAPDADRYLIQKLYELTPITFLSRVKYFADTVAKFLLGNWLVTIIWLLIIITSLVLILRRREASSSKKLVRGYLWIILGAVIIFALLSIAFALEQTRYNSFVFPEIAILLIWIVSEGRDRIVSVKYSKLFGIVTIIAVALTIIATMSGRNIENVYLADKGVKEQIRQSDLKNVVVDHSFFIAQNAVDYCRNDDEIYFMDGKNYDCSSLPDEFLLWTYNIDTWSVEEFEKRGINVEPYTSTYQANIYKCTRLRGYYDINFSSSTCL